MSERISPHSQVTEQFEKRKKQIRKLNALSTASITLGCISLGISFAESRKNPDSAILLPASIAILSVGLYGIREHDRRSTKLAQDQIEEERIYKQELQDQEIGTVIVEGNFVEIVGPRT